MPQSDLLVALQRALLNPLNASILLLQAALFVTGVIRLRAPSRATYESVRGHPDKLTALGIFGTFAGILWGLLGFDVDDIQRSIPQLLSGMTTAFSTSVVGLLLAMLFRLRLEASRKTLTSASAGATLADLHLELSEVRMAIRETAGAQQKVLADVSRAIGGDGDNTMVGQLKLLRQEQSDFSRKMERQFAEFAEKVSELGSKALIDALRQVIIDFNNKLTEQFGENFRELNAAVRDLVVWQEQYRGQVERLGQQFQACLDGIEAARSSLTSLVEKAELVPSQVQRLADLLEFLRSQEIRLAEQLEAYAGLRNQAVEAFPRIEAQLTSLTQGLATAVNQSLTTMNDAVVRHQDDARKVTAHYDQLAVQANAAVTRHDQSVRDALSRIESAYRTLESEITSAQRKANQEWQASIQKSVDDHNDLIQQQITKLDEALAEELTQALRILAGNLTSLHEKLLADYTPLTNKLRELVVLASRQQAS